MSTMIGPVLESAALESSRVLWMTAEGQVLPISDMGDRHIVMTFKLLYNHLTVVTGLPRFQMTREHRIFFILCRRHPDAVLRYMVHLYREISGRDLAPGLRRIFEEVCALLRSRRLDSGSGEKELPGGVLLLPARSAS